MGAAQPRVLLEKGLDGAARTNPPAHGVPHLGHGGVAEDFDWGHDEPEAVVGSGREVDQDRLSFRDGAGHYGGVVRGRVRKRLLDEARLPGELLQRFAGNSLTQRLVALLRFLAPLIGGQVHAL